jgi:catechol 2,3-dioxygenase-like lactoylglutathione lyase family enzyme
MPALNDLKETALYVSDLEQANTFYRDVLGLKALVSDGRFSAFDVAGKHILLLFTRGSSVRPTELPGGMIPPHDASGQIHAAFSVDSTELPAWETHLADHGIEILSRVKWPRGGQSIYFRDPDSHLLELLTPGVWSTY